MIYGNRLTKICSFMEIEEWTMREHGSQFTTFSLTPAPQFRYSSTLQGNTVYARSVPCGDRRCHPTHSHLGEVRSVSDAEEVTSSRKASPRLFANVLLQYQKYPSFKKRFWSILRKNFSHLMLQKNMWYWKFLLNRNKLRNFANN